MPSDPARPFVACVLLAAASLLPAAYAQNKKSTPTLTKAQPADDSAAETPDQILGRAWGLLKGTMDDGKHSESRIQALAALSTMKGNARAESFVAGAMKDPDLDVRTAAILAAGKMKSPSLAAPTRKLLNDPEPQVAFNAATTLWREFHDRSGEDIIVSVADGNRKASPGLMHGAEHDMSKTLHSPAAMAKLGVQESAGLLLGPFGFSVAALEYMHKNGSDNARVQAMNLLAEQKTDAVRQEMVDALTDNDPGVRAAGAKALGDLHLRTYATAVGPLIDDPKLPVRLTAAAAYINCMSGSAPVAKAKP